VAAACGDDALLYRTRRPLPKTHHGPIPSEMLPVSWPPQHGQLPLLDSLRTESPSQQHAMAFLLTPKAMHNAECRVLTPLHNGHGMASLGEGCRAARRIRLRLNFQVILRA
jgi:hypothetical protein